MPKFRKKPIEITAIQFTGSNVNEIWDAFGAEGIYGPTEKNPDYLILTTVHGDPAPARAGDWVIPDGKSGTFYPCKPDIFAATYEPVLPPTFTAYVCAHGHTWGAHRPCADCIAMQEQPHPSDPVDAQLDPAHPNIKYRLCRECTQADAEPIHRAAHAR